MTDWGAYSEGQGQPFPYLLRKCLISLFIHSMYFNGKRFYTGKASELKTSEVCHCSSSGLTQANPFLSACRCKVIFHKLLTPIVKFLSVFRKTTTPPSQNTYFRKKKITPIRREPLTSTHWNCYAVFSQKNPSYPEQFHTLTLCSLL